MRRRHFLMLAGGLSAGALLPGVMTGGAGAGVAFARHHDWNVSSAELERLDHSADAWREILDQDAWEVLFREQTERPFSSPLDAEDRDGTYICAACLLPLFSSDTKYDSGTGWPSFYAPIDGHVDTKIDLKLIWPRTEYHCKRCGGHQGHVFDDGPDPTGERWCNNGLALRFVPAEEPLPELRGRS